MKFSVLDSIRTNNFTDPDMSKKVQHLWEKNNMEVQKFLKEGIVIAGIYHNYQSDYKGDYTLSLSREDDMKGTFDTSDHQWKEYLVDAKDKLGVYNTWKKIWVDEDNHKIKRVYDFDFEQYYPNGEVSIKIAVY